MPEIGVPDGDEAPRVLPAARLGYGIGAASPWPVVLGVIAVQLGLVRPLTAFSGLLVSLLLALCAVVLAGLSLVAQRRRSNPPSVRAARHGLAYGALVLAVGIAAARPGAGTPRINDISTDLDDPPKFKIAKRVAANFGDEMEYPDAFVPIVREGYPDLGPTILRVPDYIAHYRAGRAARELDWEIIAETPHNGSIEAHSTSRLFRFVDDIVVRVRSTGPAGGESIVDVRSRSRDGKGDLGANAARIRRFLGIL